MSNWTKINVKGEHINDLEKSLIEEIEKLKKIEYITNLGYSLGQEYDKMINGTFGEEIIVTGMAMCTYLFDLFKKDIKEGMTAANVIFVGYPSLPYTDLYAPYYDSITSRRLWYRATEELDMNNNINSSLMMNTFFRWYASTYELFRKMLIFDCYCHGISTGHAINVKKYLFHSQDPSKLLSCSSKEGKKLIKCFDSTIRHSISHGNIIIIPNYFIVIRNSDESKENVVQNIFKTPEEFISKVTPNIEIMYGSIRFFQYIMTNYLFTKYSELFKKYLGNLFTDEVLIAIVKSIQANTKNPVY